MAPIHADTQAGPGPRALRIKQWKRGKFPAGKLPGTIDVRVAHASFILLTLLIDESPKDRPYSRRKDPARQTRGLYACSIRRDRTTLPRSKNNLPAERRTRLLR